jgi:beta-ureidopropionase / N-carbamoyl-L-amino-acid hydrolase
MKAIDRPNLHVDSDRLWSSLMELAQIGGTRRAASAASRSPISTGRAAIFTCAGPRGWAALSRSISSATSSPAASDPSKPPVMTGSHLDTQPTGGKFDGAYRADQSGQARLPALHSITSLE